LFVIVTIVIIIITIVIIKNWISRRSAQGRHCPIQ